MQRQLFVSMGIGILIGILVVAFGLMMVIRVGLQNARWEPSMVGYHEPGIMRLNTLPLWATPQMLGNLIVSRPDPPASYIPRLPGNSLNLSKEDVRKVFAFLLSWQGNPHLELGNVVDRNSDTILIDIVTKDTHGLVERFAVNRNSGATQGEE